MKPILFEKGTNGVFRISIRRFPGVFGIGTSEKESIEDFFAKFEDWAVSDAAAFERWYRENKATLQTWSQQPDSAVFVEVNRNL